ncbi:carbohydrate porin, partial [Enterococcus faecalis]|uniref:carbohydrate porin n=1 Tax=Enterococcus faecalis TaxID=1351 RepID=UPI0030C7EAC1
GWQHVDYDNGGDNKGWKLTLSQNMSIAMGPEFRPMLRFYVTGGKVDYERTARVNNTKAETPDDFNVGAMGEAWFQGQTHAGWRYAYPAYGFPLLPVGEGRGEGIRPHTTMLCCWPINDNITGENMGSTRKGMLNVLIAAVLWGSSGVCAQYIMEKSHISS